MDFHPLLLLAKLPKRPQCFEILANDGAIRIGKSLWTDTGSLPTGVSRHAARHDEIHPFPSWNFINSMIDGDTILSRLLEQATGGNIWYFYHSANSRKHMKTKGAPNSNTVGRSTEHTGRSWKPEGENPLCYGSAEVQMVVTPSPDSCCTLLYAKSCCVRFTGKQTMSLKQPWDLKDESILTLYKLVGLPRGLRYLLVACYLAAKKYKHIPRFLSQWRWDSLLSKKVTAFQDKPKFWKQRSLKTDVWKCFHCFVILLPEAI